METHLPGSTIYEKAFRHDTSQKQYHAQIFTEGNERPLLEPHRPKIFITGTRLPALDDIKIIRQLIAGLASVNKDIVIISGLSMGTQTHAHQEAIARDLATVAVLPSGLGKIYPKQNLRLAQQIVESKKGYLVSQFGKMVEPNIYQMLQRTNTALSLSDMVVIICSRLKGSAMVAARIANSSGIPVYAFPGNINNETSKGCNQLIAEGTATMITDIPTFCKRLKQ